MKVVFLVIDYVPHQVLSIKNTMDNLGAKVMAFHVARFSTEIPDLGLDFITANYKDFSREQVLQKINEFKPDLVIAAGWMIPEFTWVCKRLKLETDLPIVALSDTPWYGTIRQKINALLSPYHLHKAFTHLWVAGIRQYDYARKLQFANHQIIFHSLCANVDFFQKVNIELKSVKWPKNFLYVGTLNVNKGLRNVMEAWSAIEDKKGWSFTLVGEGEMREDLIQNGGFIVKGYQPQTNLLKEMQNGGCFLMASLSDQWGVALHEAAAAGLPILCTETCGAAPHFVISNYNGYTVKNNSVTDLKDKIEKIISLSDNELLVYGHRSRDLSNTINPAVQLANLKQILKC
ncbi:MAG: glycosyltransferase [Weeksellaceae bacterium]|nr:glycosyltransferase [Weeksellaceae bacterium]